MKIDVRNAISKLDKKKSAKIFTFLGSFSKMLVFVDDKYV